MTIVQQSIQEAAFKGDHNLVASLTTANPDAVRAKDEDGRTALHWAASGKHLEITRGLLAAGGDATTADDGGMTPLHIAASTGSHEIVLLLLEAAPAVIDNKTESGQTALHYAASKNHAEVVDALLNAGADPSARDRYGQTPMHRAATRGWVRIARRLKEDTRAKVNVRDATGNTPLHVAAEDVQIDMIKYLLAEGADADVENKEKQRPKDVTTDKAVQALLAAAVSEDAT
ncbi:hypothetical protein HDU87_002393 [Geranomyces variabilis]|uniref:26S proteasome non-ATPase regulatory subunit 10 n=1 Tax=Geranomyces variabilis TaxID=109894 RepID=A0AAD5TM05_9FUNG|nr:hypothetical protein HDU87_002393 [Geranomyces variabilis]